MTQPLYSTGAGRGDARPRRGGGSGAGGFPVPLLLGVLPLQSARHAEFLHNEVPGITIPDETRARDARRRATAARRSGSSRAWRCSRRSATRARRTYIMPSFGRYEQCAELVRRVRARTAAPIATPREGDGLIDARAGASRGHVDPSRRRRAPLASARPSCCAVRSARRTAPAGCRAAVPRPGDRPRGLRPGRRLRARDDRQAEATIDAIEARTGAEVVVYSQVVDYGITTEEADATPRP